MDDPMSAGEVGPDLVPLAGGRSGETFRASFAGEQSVVRIYAGPRSVARGALAPRIDAAVLRLVGGLVPVPRVREVREAGADQPGLLVTSLLPGERLDLVLPDLDAARRRALGERLGVLVARLGHLVLPSAGLFVDAELHRRSFTREESSLEARVGRHRGRLALDAVEHLALTELVEGSQALLDETLLEASRRDPRGAVLVHGDLNAQNLLVDPATLELTGVVDWELAHAGSPYADLGNLLRLVDDQHLLDAVLGAYAAAMPPSSRVPSDPVELLERARTADLVALVDLAARRGENPAADAAHAVLRGRL